MRSHVFYKQTRVYCQGKIKRFTQSVSLRNYSREKISHLSSGVECLLKSIEISTGSPGGADDLLPAIIFLLIYTNPPLFISNLNLIRRLAPPELLRRGEGAYHYCSICSGKFLHL